ncbi:hypothetical protein HDV01_003028 [Terramyces sp. JEL0728]|nr:hypothetical protein HDV01_003028 [Terramyces sp. JEL0728]
MKNDIFTKGKKELLDILATADTVIRKRQKQNLDHYTKWFDAFPKKLRQQEELSLSKEDLVSIVHWKLLNGTFRPGFIKRVEQNTEDQINAASKAAFQIIENWIDSTKVKDKETCAEDADRNPTLFDEPEIKELSDPASEEKLDFDMLKQSINQFTKLHGIGVATATAILSCIYSFIPFMSDQALFATVAKQKYQYTMQEYKLLYDTIVDEARNIGITPRELERAIWCYDVGNKQKEQIEQKYKRKPKALESKNKKK